MMSDYEICEIEIGHHGITKDNQFICFKPDDLGSLLLCHCDNIYIDICDCSYIDGIVVNGDYKITLFGENLFKINAINETFIVNVISPDKLVEIMKTSNSKDQEYNNILYQVRRFLNECR